MNFELLPPYLSLDLFLPAVSYLADIIVVFDRGDEHAEGALAANHRRRHVLDNRLVGERREKGMDEWGMGRGEG